VSKDRKQKKKRMGESLAWINVMGKEKRWEERQSSYEGNDVSGNHADLAPSTSFGSKKSINMEGSGSGSLAMSAMATPSPWVFTTHTWMWSLLGAAQTPWQRKLG